MTSSNRGSKKCHDCGVAPGEFHESGCDVERCPFCGFQLIGCDCRYELLNVPRDEDGEIAEPVYSGGLEAVPGLAEKWEAMLDKKGKIPWSGLWPGEEECRKFGFWCKENRGRYLEKSFWVECDEDDPEATEDFNRLYTECEWDAEKRQYVLRSSRGDENGH